jgi:peptidoglycan hydrolase-like protein with peptidoglycan-binding domain
MMPPDIAEVALPRPTFRVDNVKIGSSLNLTVIASWELIPLGSGAATGTITEVVARSGEWVDSGEVLYTVDLHPVVIARGNSPMFRNLASGDSGNDVKQLQQFLTDHGFYNGIIDGKFSSLTTAAVKSWQRSLAVPRTGMVLASELVFVPSLPVRVVLADAIRTGQIVSPGTDVVFGVADSPEFSAIFSAGMQQDIAPLFGSEIAINMPGATREWRGAVGERLDRSDGSLHYALKSFDDAPICRTECQMIPIADGGVAIPGQAIIVPEIEGPAVPPSAVGTAADGTRFVVNANGERVQVEVIAVNNTRIIVDGLSVGDLVLLFSETVE